MFFHLCRGGFSEMGHVLYLRGGGFRVLPGTAHDIEAFHREVNRGPIWARVMPVADHDVLRDQIDGRRRVVAARFPFAETGCFSIKQTVAPQPKLTLRRLQMVADRPHFVGEEFRLVVAFAARTLLFATRRMSVLTERGASSSSMNLMN